MTTTADVAPAVSPHTPTVGSLLRSELLRIRSRRFAKVMVAALLAVMVLVLVLAFRGTATPSAADIDLARADCVSSFGGDGSPDDASPTFAMSECRTVEQLVRHGSFVKDPAIPADLAGGVIGVGVGVAVLGFIFGCTLGGADWSNRTMPALLFWEPRRVRLFTVKLLAFALSLVAVMLAAVALWTLLYLGLIAVHGTWHDGSSGLAGAFATSLLRVTVLDVCVGLIGFGLANITRNTGAALGVAFVNFAILDTFIRIYFWRLVPWQLTTNVGALLADGGLDVNLGNHPVVHISPLRGAVVLAAYALVICGAALEIFRRRDVT